MENDDMRHLARLPKFPPKTALPEALQRMIDTMAIARHGSKHPVSNDSVAAVRLHIEDGELQITPIRHNEMFVSS